VPSALRRAGVVDSFSICLGTDLYGRIAFGDIGPLTQQTVPLLLSSSGQQDAVELETIQIGSRTIQVSSPVSFDTGQTYTFLETTIFEQFVTAYKAQESNLIPTNYTGWEICYTSPTRATETVIFSLTFPNSNVLTPLRGLFGFVNQTVSSDLHAVTSISFRTHDEIVFLKFASRFMQRAALHLLKSSVLTLKAPACVV
jgi:hypothetical protein